VEQDGSDQPNLAQTDVPGLVGCNNCVITHRVNAHQRGVEHVNEQKEENCDACDAV
jgi:hypothetical protein